MARSKNRRDGVYERRDRPGQFWASWKDANGRRRRRKLDAYTLQQARDLLAAERARAEKQRTLGYAPPTKDSVGSILDRYLKHQEPRLSGRSYERTKGIVENHVRPAFGEMRLAEIRRAEIQRYVTERAINCSAGSVMKELNCLKHFLGLAVEWELIPFNPATKIKGPRVPAGRVRYLQPTELRAVLEACPNWLRPIAALAAFTGMRRGEILGLRWMYVDLNGGEHGRLMLPQTKNGDGRIVYLNQLARDVIEGQWKRDAKTADRVFPLADDCTPDNISKGFAAVCRRLEIADFHFHDLRHTAASWLRMQGADIHTVATVLGHRDLRMAARYQHLSPEFLGAAVNRLDAIFGEPKKLPAKGESDREDSGGAEQNQEPFVTTASPEISESEIGKLEVVDLVGSAIGDRTRTLRLERAAC
jgi:integrase